VMKCKFACVERIRMFFCTYNYQTYYSTPFCSRSRLCAPQVQGLPSPRSVPVSQKNGYGKLDVITHNIRGVSNFLHKKLQHNVVKLRIARPFCRSACLFILVLALANCQLLNSAGLDLVFCL
jgi:hypothetical protein